MSYLCKSWPQTRMLNPSPHARLFADNLTNEEVVRSATAVRLPISIPTSIVVVHERMSIGGESTL